MLTLVEGPAGAGKSQTVRAKLAAGEADVQADLTALWAALRGIERGPDGLYPVRLDDDPAIRSGLAAYVRAAVVRQGLRDGLNVVVTSGTPDTAAEWQAIANESGAGFRVETMDPGEETVRRRLGGRSGRLSRECSKAMRRWYGISRQYGRLRRR